MQPFSSEREWRESWLSLLDCLLNALTLQDRSAAGKDGSPFRPQPDTGLYAAFCRLLDREALSPCGTVCGLFRKLTRTPLERLMLLLAFAPEWDRRYEDRFVRLQGEGNGRRACFGLALELCALLEEPDEREARDAAAPQSALLRFALRQEKEAGTLRLATPLAVSDALLHTARGLPGLPEKLRAACALLPLPQRPDPLLHGEEVERLRRFLSGHAERPDAPHGMALLYGAPGSGRRFALRLAAKEIGRQVLSIDCGVLLAGRRDTLREVLGGALAFCFLTDAIPALCGLDGAHVPQGEETLPPWILSETAGAVPASALCARAPLRLERSVPAEKLEISLREATIEEQKQLWEQCAAAVGYPLEGEDDATWYASIYSLTPGQMEEALAAARTACIARQEPAITREAVAHGVRALCRPRMEALAQPLRSSFTWEDLALEPETMELLKKLCGRIRYRWLVKGKWGFDAKLPYGRGVSVLLYGPPGTGKTMTAQVLAREFGMDAYRVDLSRILDKYIGETEKKLGELFDAAREANAILFFDEADALFAKRTEVEDSKDRYANAETAYLLQRMEEFHGISILATNVAQNFDEAFKRRIQFMIPVSMPGEETRKRLWRSVFPPQAPLARDVSLDFFAKRFELTGSSIKNIALAAAFLAAEEGGPIRRAHIAHALRDEYLKTGRVLMEHELY